jgi:AraC-like DNA-binding protein
MTMTKLAKHYSWQNFFTKAFPFYIGRFEHNGEEFSDEKYHLRSFWKIVYIVEGCGFYLIDNTSYAIHPGSLLIVHPASKTTYDVSGGTPLKIVNILFQPDFIKDELAKLQDNFNFFAIFKEEVAGDNPLYVFDSERKIKPLIHRMEHEFETMNDNAELLLELQLTELLILLSRHAKKQHRKYNRKAAVLRILRLIEERFSSPLTLEEISRELVLEKSRLCLIFRESQGITIMEALCRRRLLEAEKLLKETNLPILQICYQCGFRDVSAFYRRFQKSTGTTPQKYRRQGAALEDNGVGTCR